MVSVILCKLKLNKTSPRSCDKSHLMLGNVKKDLNCILFDYQRNICSDLPWISMK